MNATDFLLTNGGLLDPSWFPGLDLTGTLLPKWVGVAPHPEGVYALAFTTLVNNLMSEPADQRDRDKSSAFTAEQLKYWQAQALHWRRRADALSGAGTPALARWEGDSVWPPRT